jgi:glycosyltransferase involved in cell wall biosynthesis
MPLLLQVAKVSINGSKSEGNRFSCNVDNLENKKKIIIFANTDWYLYNFRYPLIRELMVNDFHVLLLSPRGDYAHRFAEDKIRWRSIEFSRRGLNPIREFSTIIKLVRILLQERPDILQTFTLKSNLLGAIAGKLLGPISIVHSITGLGYLFGQRMRKSVITKFLLLSMRVFFRGSQVIFQNTENMNFFRERKIVSKKHSHLIPGSGVDVDYFVAQAEMEGSVLVVFAGRYLRDKGVIEFIEAAEKIKEMGVDARFAIVGGIDTGNPESLKAEELVELNRAGAVEDWGWREDMKEVYRLAHIVCLPSSYAEGLPKVLIEASASGRAIVATDIAGCREIVEDGKSGYIVPVGDADALVQALENLIQDSKVRVKMGREGRLRAEKEFSTAVINQQTLDVYSQGRL